MCIYLYVKTHKITGLKYLGKTKAKNPIKYPGSGTRWTNHLKVHGYYFDTEILRECETAAEVKEWGIYYSKLFNVVEDHAWANLKFETGDGGAYPSSGLHMKLPEYRALASANNCMKDPKHRIRMIQNNPMNNQEYRDKISSKLKGKAKSAEHKKNIYNPMLTPEISNKRKGKNNPLYNHTVYCFEHVSTSVRVSMTQDDMVKSFGLRRGNVSNLIRGRIKSSLGWQLVNPDQ
jgi:hypothetical protein